MIAGKTQRPAFHIDGRKRLSNPVTLYRIAGFLLSTKLCLFLHIPIVLFFVTGWSVSVLVQVRSFFTQFWRQNSGVSYHSRAPPSDFDFASY